MTQHEPELGQMIFGNPTMGLSIDDEDDSFVAAELYDLSKTLGEREPTEQAHGLLGGEWGYGQKFSNDVFSMSPYYWGDCTCGYEQREEEWENTHAHEPDCFNTLFNAKLEEIDEVGTGDRYELVYQWAEQNGYPEARQGGMAVHCTCGYAEEWHKWATENDHDSECLSVVPNFTCGDVKLTWYKWIGRSMAVNKEVTRQEWREIFARCFASL